MGKEPEFRWGAGKIRMEGAENFKRSNTSVKVYDDHIFVKYDGPGFFSGSEEMKINYENVTSVSSGGAQTITLRTIRGKIRISGMGAPIIKKDVLSYIESRI